MIPALRAFVAEALGWLGETPDPVVEFGAMQAEAGQDADLRPLFCGRDFTGTDFREGPGVDRVEDLRSLSYGDGSVGTAICLETLEHVEDPIAAGRELARVVSRDGGVCLVSTPLLLGIHGYPDDFFRFTPAGLGAVLAGFDSVWTAGIGDAGMPVSVVAVAAQGRSLEGLTLDALPTLRSEQERWDRGAGTVRIGALRVPPRELIATTARELARLAGERVRRSR
ncbi:MAG TPA: methyltransferase domain-containing protein [Solirubrobacteraceae bacterium]|jgi:hypothetical protein